MRDELKQSGNEAIEAARRGIEWVADSRNGKTVGTERTSAERSLRRLLVDSKKVVDAIDRPMCVSVFGPSQAGKSYLVSMLAKKGDRPLEAKFRGHDNLNFIEEINPSGGTESTGLVTRFSIKNYESPDGFPVRLRMLTETDIIKILGNSFFHDGMHDEENEVPLSDIDTLIEQAKSRAGNEKPAGNILKPEDIWDIQDYFEKHFSGYREMSYMKPLLSGLDEVLPYLGLGDRCMVFEKLWGGYPQFSKLYTDLVTALCDLDHPKEAFCKLDALLPRSSSIIDVATLSGLGEEGAPLLTIRSASGAQANLPRPVIAALTAELYICLSDKPWDFFDHTDLLDFPGARSRQQVEMGKFLAGETEMANPLMELLRRGKVAYLFDRYVAEQEITSMLLCVKPGPQEVISLPEMIRDWIGSSHGNTPQERVGSPVVLFFVLAWFDEHLKDAAGEAKSDPGLRFQNRINSSLVEFFGKTSDWPFKWTPGQPFNNCFWLRNPGVPAEHIIRYQDGKEIEVLPEKVKRLEELKTGYLGVQLVQNHFADPARAFDEALKLNDGGVSYLANSLGPVCQPDLKYQQIKARLTKLREKISAPLKMFYVDDDVQKRRTESREQAQKTLVAIRDQVAGKRELGSFLKSLQTTQQEMSGVVARAYRSNVLEESKASTAGAQHAPAHVSADLPPVPGLDLPPIPGMDPAVEQTQSRNGPEKTMNGSGDTIKAGKEYQIARAVVQHWTEELYDRVESGMYERRFGLSKELVSKVVEELVFASRRTDLPLLIAERFGKLKGSANESVELVIERSMLVATTILNSFVCRFGLDLVPANERPAVNWRDGKQTPAFERRPVNNCISSLPAEAKNLQYDFFLEWMVGFIETVDRNATSEAGQSVDPEQNSLLGEIIDMLNNPEATGPTA